MKRTKAFTLVELLVVISITSLLSSVVLSSLNGARSKAKIAAGRQFAGQVNRIAGDQPIALWDFDECSSSSSVDLSRNGYTATPNGATASPTTPTGSGCSMLFDGTNDYIDTSYPSTDQTNWTMSAWVYDTKNNGAYRAIIQTLTTGDVALYVYPSNYIGYYNCGVTGAVANSFPPNEWVHVTATYDSSVGLKYYQNGQLVGSRAGVCGTAGHFDYIHIGGIDVNDSERWKGYIDEVHIFSKTLTASEVGRLYALEVGEHAFANAVK